MKLFKLIILLLMFPQEVIIDLKINNEFFKIILWHGQLNYDLQNDGAANIKQTHKGFKINR